MTNLIIVQFDV